MQIKILNLLIILGLSACSAVEDGRIKPPLVYRIDIQQGNVVDQSMLNKLRPGMDQKQVRFIMGTPLLIDPFHPERWEYLYFFQESTEEAEQRHITLFFREGQLSHLRGDVKVSHLPVEEDTSRTEKSVIVPEGYTDRGLFERWFKDRPERIEVEERPDHVIEEEGKKILQQKTDAVEETLDVKQQSEETDTETLDEYADNTVIDEPEQENIEDEEESEPGFFSNIWDSLSNDDDADILEPTLENQ